MPISLACLALLEDGTTLYHYVLVGILAQHMHARTNTCINSCLDIQRYMQNFSAAEMMQAVSFAIFYSLENKLFDQFTVLWWADYLVFHSEYD